MSELLTHLIVQKINQDLAIFEAAQAVADQCAVVLEEIQKLKASQPKPLTVTITHKSIYDLMPQET